MENNKKTTGISFPKDFVEYESNLCSFDDHIVGYEIYNHDNKEWTWDVVVTNREATVSSSFEQYPEDSAKWSFYEVYKHLCCKLGIKPAQMP